MGNQNNKFRLSLKIKQFRLKIDANVTESNYIAYQQLLQYDTVTFTMTFI